MEPFPTPSRLSSYPVDHVPRPWAVTSRPCVPTLHPPCDAHPSWPIATRRRTMTMFGANHRVRASISMACITQLV